MHLFIMHIELFVGVFGTKCCVLYSNKYSNLHKGPITKERDIKQEKLPVEQ